MSKSRDDSSVVYVTLDAILLESNTILQWQNKAVLSSLSLFFYLPRPLVKVQSVALLQNHSIVSASSTILKKKTLLIEL